MARRISIPFLVDVVTLDRPAEAAEVEAHPQVTRGLSWEASYLGRLVNRLRLRRIATVLEVEGRLLPVFLAREDQERAAEQAALEDKLNALVAAGGGWRAEEIAEIVGLLRAGGDETRLGIAVQGLLGRLFDPGYEATRTSYEAARVLGEWPRAGLLKALRWRLTGRVWRARDEIWRRAGQDRLGIHATCIGLHNIVDSLRVMGRLWADPVTRGRMAEARVVGQCLQAPPSLLRRSTGRFEPGFDGRRVEKHALLVIDLERLHGGSADSGLAFAAGQWNQCPAHRFVPALLIAVWRALSADDDGAGGGDAAREAAE